MRGAKRVLGLAAVLACGSARAGAERRGAVADGGGGAAAAPRVQVAASVAGVGGLTTADARGHVVKSGFAGQLYELSELMLAAEPAAVGEGGTSRVSAAARADDGSVAALEAAPSWSVLAGPLTGVSAEGVATAGAVYADTTARVAAVSGWLAGEVSLVVRNVGDDDFGLYAGDGLADDWQVSFFGLDNPEAAPDADPDGDRQDNAYERVTGTAPTNGQSRLVFRLGPTVAPPGEVDLLVEPAYADRFYLVARRGSLTAGTWQPLAAFEQEWAGERLRIRDVAATNPAAFYRLEVSLAPP